MDVSTAAAICHPQERTLALADELIGEVNLRNAKLEAEADVSPEYRAASKALETISINLHAYTRGMVSKDALPNYIKQARRALTQMERALS